MSETIEQITLEQWRERTKLHGGLFGEKGGWFVPHTGVCYGCGVKLVKYHNETGRLSSTGCPACNKSYCD